MFVYVAPRDGLMSWTLFFRDRPGPVERAEEVLDFSGGRTGEDSLEANGELLADAARVETVFFVVVVVVVGGGRDVVESRGFDAVVDFASESEIWRKVSEEVSDLALEKMEEEVLSSMATVVCCGERVRGSNWDEFGVVEVVLLAGCTVQTRDQ